MELPELPEESGEVGRLLVRLTERSLLAATLPLQRCRPPPPASSLTRPPSPAPPQLRRRDLNSFWKGSCFHVGVSGPSDGASSSSSAGAGAGAGDSAARQAALTSVLALNELYFPEELYTSKQKV